MTTAQPGRRSLSAFEAVRHALAARVRRATALHIVLLAMFLTYVWRAQQIFPVLGMFKVTLLVSLLAIGMVALGTDSAALSTVFRNRVVRYASLVVLWMVLSVPLGVYPGHTLRFIYEDFIKTYIFFVIILLSIRCFRDVERLALMQILGAIFFSVMSLTRNSIDSDGRLTGVNYYDANDFGLVALCTLPLVVHFALKKKALNILLGLPVIGLLLTVVAMTGSRGSFLGLIAFVLYFLFGFKSVSRGVRVAVLAVGATAFVTTASDTYWDSVRTIFAPKDDYNWAGNNPTGRMEIWKRGFGYMVQHPITGVGAGAFTKAEGTSAFAKQRLADGVGTKWSAAHNSFVQVGAELGFPGLYFFLAMLWLAFRGCRIPDPRLPRDVTRFGQALGGSLVAFAVSGSFVSAAYTAYLFSMIAFAAGYYHLVQTALAENRAAAGPVARSRAGFGRGGIAPRTAVGRVRVLTPTR